MNYLHGIPDFDGLPSLQKLTLAHCRSLEKIHSSLGKHKNLEYVRVDDCIKLRTFPTIIHLRKLKTLQIMECHKFLKFPEIKSNMESLVDLSLKGIGIDFLLASVGERCANLISLWLRDCFYLTCIEANFDGLKHLENFRLNGLNYLKMPYYMCTSRLIDKVVCGRYQDRSPSIIKSLFVCSQLLRELDLSFCWLEDGEMPSGIGEMSNLERLNLRGNKFSRLDFTLTQLPRLKFLDISFTMLVQLPKIPSSLMILHANYCKLLTTIGDCYTKCKWLYNVSLKGVRIINGCSKLLESMLQGKAAENHFIQLDLEGVEIAKEFIPPLLIGGSRYKLKLPENWFDGFSGFLMCAVVSDGSSLFSLNMKQVISAIECEDDVVWEESDCDEYCYTHVWYVSFASLRNTKWWNTIYKALSISFHVSTCGTRCSGFGVRLVGRKSRDGPTEASTTQKESEFSWYMPQVCIRRESEYALEIVNTTRPESSHSSFLRSCYRSNKMTDCQKYKRFS